MSAAFVIEVRGLQAGLVVRQESGGFRFFAAVAEAFSLEGQVFRSAAHAGRAVRSALDAPRAR
ncbi:MULTISPECIES: hypothetical protein [Methylopila]|uniref:Uncharacterized protein n=2 Tax=Methylopila TaxID=61653 RepID=A0A9W6JKA0_9HYPH|nr:hypothetical protein [Methylopila turkensis]GLK79215.1 hypothetical protein GCM10008174_09560 [Methylopila turkensis]